jgi:hypothetical protein
MKPKHVAALAALGLAGLLGLVLLWRGSQAAGETSPETLADDPTAGASNASQRPRPQLATTAEARAAGELPSILDVDTDAGAKGPRVYVREDGVLVRDHRARATMMSSSELVRPKTAPAKMEPTTIIAVRNAMRPIVFRCAEAIPAASMGEDPRLQGEVMVSIAEGNLRVDDAVMKLADVEESAAAPMRDCVVQGVRDIHLATPEAADVTRTTLTLPFRLRR